MKVNSLLILIWLAVAAVGYMRLPDLLQDYTRDWQAYEIEMVFTSAAVVVGALAAVACLAVIVVYGRKPR